ncbi:MULTISPECIES: Uma2 family endonuclease [unclassified Micromonospora]|uniref:Uma2 family endonuclease n=1 Tax=unclassified Micromonospora TaxID=2617518 RepID=UPI00188FADC6|nr:MULTISPECIES: Uma2 family endonuclease [unclassified Micromonospora]MBF5029633.1 Uma2 family endonuclease [Micromonospora sp. ANENR4]MCZ7473782.1 Uma2 family endonuclease [Micromonospora sp. WMMC273]WBC04451.1 Uma2 family endonuclease [Micromonospora sp. WMMA1976]
MSGGTSSDAERSPVLPGTAAVPAGELARRQGAEPVTSLDDLARPDLIGSDEELEVLLADLDASRHRDRPDRDSSGRSLDLLGCLDQPWTAAAALDLLPENNGPRIEVLRGCVIVTPGSGVDRRTAHLHLAYLIGRAARAAGRWGCRSVNLVSADDLFIPDLAVLRHPAGGLRAVTIEDALLVGEIAPSGVIDRPREYATAGVPYFLRVDLRNRVPALALYELVDGEYRPLAAAAAGTTFVMRQPFEFSVDPADLLDEEAPQA